MRKTLGILATILVPVMAHADDCPDLGLPNAYLNAHFCAQLKTLSDADGGLTRSLNDTTSDTGPDAEWRDIGIIQDAYRADPRKTLELIERIRNAGGLREQ